MIGLTYLGYCSSCSQWLVCTKSWLPDHYPVGQEAGCPNSRYSPNGHRYKVESEKDAISLAEWLSQDDGRCFKPYGGHSASCGDGRECEAERRMRAQALASYFLENIKSEPHDSIPNRELSPA